MCGEVNRPVFMPRVSRHLATFVETLPLPFVPVTCTMGSRRKGLPRTSFRRTMFSSPSLVGLYKLMLYSIRSRLG